MTGLSLPRKCGVMLLPDCTLFPHGGLPLFIYEQRYRKMLDDALQGDCIFAIARDMQEGPGEEEKASRVGTAGLVRASKEGEDGTSHLLLHGVIRVKFSEWLDDEAYPCAVIEPLPCVPLEAGQAQAAMKTLRGSVEDAVAHMDQEIKASVMILLEQADEPGLMSDLVAQQFVRDPDLRQELLEMDSVGERVGRLCEFFQKEFDPG
ncbi:LON peptidase substrate-binding domain-containing protein [Luteolibacter sp. AS25]|uniref:LON peptidase substrate-binding domain-containing protein n=1 Tax=Luteolibacter sp. AS25 TaxID=3135776 RepID=UPI00398B6CD0